MIAVNSHSLDFFGSGGQWSWKFCPFCLTCVRSSYDLENSRKKNMAGMGWPQLGTLFPQTLGWLESWPLTVFTNTGQVMVAASFQSTSPSLSQLPGAGDICTWEVGGAEGISCYLFFGVGLTTNVQSLNSLIEKCKSLLESLYASGGRTVLEPKERLQLNRAKTFAQSCIRRKRQCGIRYQLH